MAAVPTCIGFTEDKRKEAGKQFVDVGIAEEHAVAMLEWSIEQEKYPVAIGIACNGVIHTDKQVEADYSNLNKYQMTQQGEEIAIIALGDFYQIGDHSGRRHFRWWIWRKEYKILWFIRHESI